MAIITTRAEDAASVTIDGARCIGCGLCVSVCKDFGLKLEDGRAVVSDAPVFGCFACGHCAAVCPASAIDIEGRTLSASDIVPLDGDRPVSTFDDLRELMLRRRSIREFTDQPVDGELIDKIVEASSTAPMGLTPSDVNLLIFDSREKLDGFAADFCGMLESMKWLVADWFLNLMRPFWGKANDQVFRGFLKPLAELYTARMEKGENLVTYSAPAGIYFYASAYADPADPIVAATYAMLAAESLGLGSCMLGGIHPLIQNGRKAAALRAKYGIRRKSREGIFVVFGHPALHYKKSIRRSFAAVDRI